MKTSLKLASIAALICLVSVNSAIAQDEPVEAEESAADVVRVSIVGLNRRYAQPLRKTAQRIQQIEGIKKAEMLGWELSTASFALTTDLDQQQLASSVGMKFVCETTEGLLFAPEVNDAAKRAEARQVIKRIGLAVYDLYTKAKPEADEDNDEKFLPLLEKLPRLKDKLSHLGIQIDDLEGKFYAADDYHIKEYPGWNDTTCRVWVGDEWADFGSDQNGDWGYVEYNSGDENHPELDPRFVGMEVKNGPWSGTTKRWVDKEAAMAGGMVTRSDKEDDELVIQTAAAKLVEYVGLAMSYQLHNPKKSVESLNNSNVWEMNQWFSSKFKKEAPDAWDWPADLDYESMQLSWERDDGKLTLTAKVEYPGHPYHLHLIVDATAVRDAYIVKDEMPDGIADIDKQTEWIVDAEEESVFESRRAEASDIHERLIKLVGSYLKATDTEDVYGVLSDADLCKRLDYEHSAESRYLPGHISLRRQLFGDIEVTVGNSFTGGKYWVLFD
ncbi:MAG: hypothetical protein ACYTDT_13200, partial [Planctomycetota bacterium]